MECENYSSLFGSVHLLLTKINELKKRHRALIKTLGKYNV